MKYFQLFESFVNEAKLSDYSLKDQASPKYIKFIAEEVGPTIIEAFEKEGFKSLNDKPIKRQWLWSDSQTFEFKKKISGDDYIIACFIRAQSGFLHVNFTYYLNYTEPSGSILSYLRVPGEVGSRGNNADSIAIDKMSKLTNGKLIAKINDLAPSVTKNAIKNLEDVIKSKYQPEPTHILPVNMTQGLLSNAYKYSDITGR